ncbi:MAG: hypothetical protein CSB24_01640 [Deltaproteobacteria bacterium]|nr:MAG: hypothetical protein CSB24_01640 [Deltaproteobacteria bacterium]
MIDEKLIKIIACPQCKGHVKADKRGIVCEKCRLVYPVHEGIPVMLVEESRRMEE